MKKISIILASVFISSTSYGQTASDSITSLYKDLSQLKQDLSKTYGEVLKLTDKDLRTSQKRFEATKEKIVSTAFFLDAANTSLTSLSTAIKNVEYRNKIASLNNPTSSELGFNLETELVNTLKPLLDKSKDTDKDKFNDIVRSVINSPLGSTISTYVPAAGVINTVLNLVCNLTVNEKKITKEDLKDFQQKLNKFFEHYEKLAKANQDLKFNLEKLSLKTEALTVLIKQFAIERAMTLNPDLKKEDLLPMTLEKILLDYYDSYKITKTLDAIVKNQPLETKANVKEIPYDKLLEQSQFHYPGDGAFIAREIASEIEKTFKEYAVIYADNYSTIKQIVESTKTLTSTIDKSQVDQTLKELDAKYIQSSEANKLNAKLTTLYERLKAIPVF
jgi:hypothetical protein